MRRSKKFLTSPANGAKQARALIQPSNEPRPSAQVRGRASFLLYLNNSSPRLRVSAVSGLVCLILSVCAAAQTPAPQLSADLAHSPGWVVISVDDYQNIRTPAFPTEREPEPPPVDATLTRVDYDLRIAGELATGRASLTVDVL